eukprot:364963-Chlamydomonas_euryale.AAC.4
MRASLQAEKGARPELGSPPRRACRLEDLRVSTLVANVGRAGRAPWPRRWLVPRLPRRGGRGSGRGHDEAIATTVGSSRAAGRSDEHGRRQHRAAPAFLAAAAAAAAASGAI